MNTTIKRMNFVLNKEEMNDIIITTFANKKSRMLFYTKREIILFKDGSFAYKRKNKSIKIKLIIKPQEIDKLSL